MQFHVTSYQSMLEKIPTNYRQLFFRWRKATLIVVFRRQYFFWQRENKWSAVVDIFCQPMLMGQRFKILQTASLIPIIKDSKESHLWASCIWVRWIRSNMRAVSETILRLKQILSKFRIVPRRTWHWHFFANLFLWLQYAAASWF